MRTPLRHLPRVREVVSVLIRFVVVPSLAFGPAVPPAPVRTRLALERLGGAWIKLGQMLALRYDLVPAAYCDELFKLLDQVRPFPYDDVREIVRQELGGTPEAIFEAFEPESFAAASIGQVHRAVLRTGERVAVKVQRPRIREVMRADIDLMYALGRVFDRTHLFGGTRTRAVIDEFARWTADELDYMVEARQAVLLGENARGEPLEKIPRVYRDYTTSRVLTTELIEGIPLIEIIRAVREGNQGYLARLAAEGYDRDRIVSHLDWNMLNQVYVFGVFHADLHPANLFVLPGNAIGYVDFGIIGQLPLEVRGSLTRYGRMLFQGDVEAATGELMRWLALTGGTDSVAARRQLIRAHEAFLYAVGSAGAGAPGPSRDGRRADNPYSGLAVDIMKTIRINQLTLSPSVVAYLRMLVTIGTVRHQLATRYDVTSQVRRFFGRMMRQEALSWLDPRLAIGRMYAGGTQVRRALEFLQFLEDQQPAIQAAEGTFLGLERRVRSLRRRIIALGAAALVVGAALYVVVADPRGTRAFLPSQVPYPVVHAGLVALLGFLIVALVVHLARFGRAE